MEVMNDRKSLVSSATLVLFGFIQEVELAKFALARNFSKAMIARRQSAIVFE